MVLKGKGQVSYEWPAYAVGWKLPHLDGFFKANGFHDFLFHGCALGLKDKGKPVQKPWRLKATSFKLAETLSQYKCNCSPGAHAPCQGRITSASENYTPQMERVIIEALLCLSASPSPTHVSKPSGAPVQLQALCGSCSQDAQLDLFLPLGRTRNEG